jgi:hypothetical protein
MDLEQGRQRFFQSVISILSKNNETVLDINLQFPSP